MRRPLVKPRPLAPGRAIGVFTPSSPVYATFPEKYRHGVKVLESLGFPVVEGFLTRSGRAQGYRSGSPEERARELMELVVDPRVGCVMASIGGMNSSSMIPYLDFDVIRRERKIISGYSDVTALHLAVWREAGLATLYGPGVMPSFGEWPTALPYTVETFLEAVQRHRSGSRVVTPPAAWSRHFRDAGTDAWKTVPRAMHANAGWRALRRGAADGPLVVMNLNTALGLAGTKYFPDLDGAILVLEEMNAPLAREERSFRQLQLLGVFDRIAGLVLGKVEFPDKPSAAPFTLDDLLVEVVGPRPFPIVTEFDCAHTVPLLSLGTHVRARLEVGEGTDVRLTLAEPFVED